MKLAEVAQDRAFDYKYLYKKMYRYIKPYLFRGVLGVLIAIPAGLLETVPALAIKYYFDLGINGKNEALAQTILFWVPFAVIGFAFLQGILKYLNAYLNDWTAFKMSNLLKFDLFKKLLSLEPAFYDQNTSGFVMSRFLNDAGAATSGLILNLKTLITLSTSAIAFIAVLIFNSWKLSFVAVLMLGSAFLPVSLIRKHVKKVSMEQMRIGSQINSNFYETFNGNKIITSFNLQNHFFEKFKDQVIQAFNFSMGLTKRVGWLSPLMYLIASFGIAGVLWYGNILLASGELTIGGFFSFVTALLLLYKPFKSLGNTMAGMQSSFVAMNRVFDLFDIEPTIKNKENALKIDTIKNSIKFENVWFEYEENTPVLKNINLDIRIGESVALVGNSGGGKTTVANLIPRFYDVKEGSIKIDGVDVRNIEMESLRQNISIVFQDNFLFSGTIKENILLGKSNATDVEINKALKDAYLDEFVASQADGIHTEIGERGVKLSGGQKQRLAIARAMIKNTPVVILDEATSALDNKSEAVVQKAMDKLMENKTVIVIAHRLSTVQNVDKIVVANQGEIVEMGSHSELINISNGIYKGLYDMQFNNKEVTV